jgi:hypothetical protein
MNREHLFFGVAVVAIAVAIIIVTASFVSQPQVPQQNYTGPSTCADGTVYGQCSLDKPLYCDAGNLIPDCNFCGCVIGLTCDQASGGCLTEIAVQEEEPEPQVPEPEPEEESEEWCVDSEEYASTPYHITAGVELIHASSYYRTSYRSIDWVYEDTPLLIMASLSIPEDISFSGTEVQTRIVCGNETQYGKTHSIRTPRESTRYHKYALWDNLTACEEDFVIETKLTYTVYSERYTYCPSYSVDIRDGDPEFVIEDFHITDFYHINNTEFRSKMTVEFEPSGRPTLDGVWLLTEDGEELYEYSDGMSHGYGEISLEETSCAGDTCRYDLGLDLSPTDELVYRVCDKDEGLYLIYSSHKDRDYAESFLLVPNHYFDEICGKF